MEDGSYPMRVTLRLVSHNHVPDARYSAAAATAALAAANPALHGPAASAAAAAAAAGAAAAAACSAMSHPNRGVLLPLPPTLTALRSAAMDAARADPHFKALMAAGRTQRRRDRAALRRDQRKRRRLEASAVADEERQGPEPVAAATADGDADDEEEEGADSEDESTDKLPAFWPFHFRFYIDGGELRSPNSYAALVRDRDCIDTELLISSPDGSSRISLEAYVRAHEVDAKLPATAAAAVAGSEDAELELGAPLHSPLTAAHRGSKSTLTAAPRSHTAAGRPSPSAHSDTTAATRKTDSTTAAAPTVKPGGSSVAAPSAANGRSPSSGPPQEPTGVSTFLCCSRGCDKRATLGPCPHCKDIGNKTSFFCSQECYTRNWKKHSAEFHPSTA